MGDIIELHGTILMYSNKISSKPSSPFSCAGALRSGPLCRRLSAEGKPRERDSPWLHFGWETKRRPPERTDPCSQGAVATGELKSLPLPAAHVAQGKGWGGGRKLHPVGGTLTERAHCPAHGAPRRAWCATSGDATDSTGANQ